MAVITIEYQIGCGGRDIGRKLAERLGFSYMDREIVQGVARELQIDEAAAELHDERVAGVLGRVLDMMRMTGELTWVAPERDPGFTLLDEATYHGTTCRVIEAAARRDHVVIVGHGSAFALAGWPGVMHVGLYAPAEQRVATVMSRLQISRDEARRRVSESDHDRARYVKRFYHVNWHDADHYHFMANTGVFAPDQVVDLIAQAWRVGRFGEPSAAPPQA